MLNLKKHMFMCWKRHIQGMCIEALLNILKLKTPNAHQNDERVMYYMIIYNYYMAVALSKQWARSLWFNNTSQKHPSNWENEVFYVNPSHPPETIQDISYTYIICTKTILKKPICKDLHQTHCSGYPWGVREWWGWGQDLNFIWNVLIF